MRCTIFEIWPSYQIDSCIYKDSGVFEVISVKRPLNKDSQF